MANRYRVSEKPVKIMNKRSTAVTRKSTPARKSAPAKRSSGRLGLFSDIIAELKKVVWLSRRDLIRLTGMVLIVTIIMGLLLGIIDYGFTRLVNDIFLAG
jgi:preprotein translocase subunit SecE